MKKRQPYIHCFFERSLGVPFQTRVDGKTTLCGKTAIRIRGTAYKNSVTCPGCITEMKKRYWYCVEHGFLEDIDITDDGRCSYCDLSVLG
jgi:hypothetical protein